MIWLDTINEESHRICINEESRWFKIHFLYSFEKGTSDAYRDWRNEGLLFAGYVGLVKYVKSQHAQQWPWQVRYRQPPYTWKSRQWSCWGNCCTLDEKVSSRRLQNVVRGLEQPSGRSSSGLCHGRWYLYSILLWPLPVFRELLGFQLAIVHLGSWSPS